MTATVTPEDATNKSVVYTQIDTGVAGLSVNSDGLVSWTDATPVGSYSFTVETVDGAFTDTFILSLTQE